MRKTIGKAVNYVNKTSAVLCSYAQPGIIQLMKTRITSRQVAASADSIQLVFQPLFSPGSSVNRPIIPTVHNTYNHQKGIKKIWN